MCNIVIKYFVSHIRLLVVQWWNYIFQYRLGTPTIALKVLRVWEAVRLIFKRSSSPTFTEEELLETVDGSDTTLAVAGDNGFGILKFILCPYRVDCLSTQKGYLIIVFQEQEDILNTLSGLLLTVFSWTC
jgi:hypothetical protein